MQFATIIEIASLLVPLLIGTSNTLFKGKLKWVVMIVAYFILKKWAVKAAEDKAQRDLQSNNGTYTPAALATLYKQALNPSGYAFMIEMDGTSEELVYETAKYRPQKFSDVWEKYKLQYGRNLTDDLQKELSGEEYSKFLQIVNR
jgi:hypothetical protein